MIRLARYALFILPIGIAPWVGMACGGGEPATEEEAAVVSEDTGTPPAMPGYEVIDVTDGGTIKGVVRFVGTVPPPQTVEVTEDADACGQTREVQAIQTGLNSGLADVVVTLSDIGRGAALKASGSPPVVDQAGCRFAPHVSLVPAGTTLDVLNSDPITHNIHTLAFENRPINKAQPSSMKKVGLSFKNPEKVKVNCDIHEWMGAWIVVMDHPYYAVTTEEGAFSIPNVPPGTYTLEIWHESLATQTQQVTISPGETTEVTFEMSPEA